MSAEGSQPYSREAYERGEKEIEHSYDQGVSAQELRPKFEKQVELKNQAWEKQQRKTKKESEKRK